MSTTVTTSPKEQTEETTVCTSLKKPCVDYVAQCPPEVLRIIFSYLGPKTVATCLDVSRTWRSRIPCVPSLWREIDLIHTQFQWSISRISAIMPYFSKHTQKLHITGSEKRISTILDDISNNHFPQLTSLRIQHNGKFK